MKTLVVGALTAISAGAYAATANVQPKFVAHEWGTFTSLIGSNGITQNGMYHEDEALPDFVHGFGETIADARPTPAPMPTPTPPRHCNRKICLDDQTMAANKITQKMETPVIYFYSDRALHAQVNVRFPEGVITETYPAPLATFPSKKDDLVIANGNTTFDIDILAPDARPVIHEVSSQNIYSHARAVASNFVSAIPASGRTVENEKFIFYRGLGRFQPEIQITSEGSSLTLRGTQASLPQAAFLVDVDASGDTRMLDLREEFGGNFNADVANTISAERIAFLTDHSAHEGNVNSGSKTRDALTTALIAAGLRTDEAAAMVNTWANGYLKVPGLRLLYILPRAEVDRALPLTISPTPAELTRVFVGRIEVLLQSQEQKLLNEIETSTNFDVATLGRFAEPILRRIQQVSASRDFEPFGLAMKINGLIARAAQSGAVGSDVSTTSAH